MNASGSPELTQCPRCKQETCKKVGDQRTACKFCSTELRRIYQFCSACQREWPQAGESVGDTCNLPGCGIRAALLSSDVITDPGSSVVGCPFFRACPSCKNLLMHSGEGCPNIICPHCNIEFCFRCLKKDCGHYIEDDEDYDDDSSSEDDDDYEGEVGEDGDDRIDVDIKIGDDENGGYHTNISYSDGQGYDDHTDVKGCTNDSDDDSIDIDGDVNVYEDGLLCTIVDNSEAIKELGF